MGCCYSTPPTVSPAQEEIDLGPLYSGPRAEYTFINVDVTLGAKISLFSSTLITSDVDVYYEMLAMQYNNGYRLLSFYHIPGQGRRKGQFSMRYITTFQGIFCRYHQEDFSRKYQLKIEKSIIELELNIIQSCLLPRQTQVTSNISHLKQIIESNAANGARLICIELTGRGQIKRTWKYTMPSLGVDVFFEVPLDRASETYTYNIVSVPILVTYTNGFRPVPVTHCDWQATLDEHLKQGYRLVEIFMDDSNYTKVYCCSGQVELGCQWFFEKQTSKLDDLRPVYEGKVVEHYIKISLSGLSRVKTKAEWEPVIESMGRNGWELACILETSNMIQTGAVTFYMKVILFFQRKIIH